MRPGLRVPGAWDGFEVAVRAVLGQQLTSVDSPAVVGRLVCKFGQAVEAPVSGLSRLFPRPEILAAADLPGLGISKQAAEGIGVLARMVVAEKVSFDGHHRPECLLTSLRDLSGMSEAGLAYVAMRSLGDPDAIPHADAGIRRTLHEYGCAASPQQLLKSFEEFRPWRAYAAMHLWSNANRL